MRGWRRAVVRFPTASELNKPTEKTEIRTSFCVYSVCLLNITLENRKSHIDQVVDTMSKNWCRRVNSRTCCTDGDGLSRRIRTPPLRSWPLAALWTDTRAPSP